MDALALSTSPARTPADWTALARALGETFAERAERHDENDLFVAENYEDLKSSGLIAAGVPAELGGGGADHGELAAVLREIARHCGSTALALSMHTHQVAVAAWRWRFQNAPVEPLLRRIAQENILIVSSGGSDWLDGSGTATRVEGGFLVNARKIFASGAPAGDLLMTSAVYDDPADGPTVLHFGVPMRAVRIQPTWKALGMRGTGSHDLAVEDFFLADAAVGGRRPQGKWHPLFHIISMLAIPLIYSVYLGVAESARDLAVKLAARRKTDANTQQRVGAMDTELTAARLAWDEMLAAAATNAPGPETTNRVFMGRQLLTRAALRTVELALEAGGGGAFYRGAGIERRFRDVQGARYHPLQEGAQRTYAGRMALGLDIDGESLNKA